LEHKARYVKVIAYNYGKLPEWHQGAGGDAFIFIDEIEINPKIENKIFTGSHVYGGLEFNNNFYFDKNSISYKNETKFKMMEFSEILKIKLPTIEIEIRGHCDVTEKNSQELSLNRAKAIKEYLVSNGIDKSRISTKGLLQVNQ
jgi:outer membrane protein OmpA-like peptidoglycan-associated protein